jgi:hypothetical protein
VRSFLKKLPRRRDDDFHGITSAANARKRRVVALHLMPIRRNGDLAVVFHSGTNQP